MERNSRLPRVGKEALTRARQFGKTVLKGVVERLSRVRTGLEVRLLAWRVERGRIVLRKRARERFWSWRLEVLTEREWERMRREFSEFLDMTVDSLR